MIDRFPSRKRNTIILTHILLNITKHWKSNLFISFWLCRFSYSWYWNLVEKLIYSFLSLCIDRLTTKHSWWFLNALELWEVCIWFFQWSSNRLIFTFVRFYTFKCRKSQFISRFYRLSNTRRRDWVKYVIKITMNFALFYLFTWFDRVVVTFFFWHKHWKSYSLTWLDILIYRYLMNRSTLAWTIMRSNTLKVTKV